MSSVTGKQVSRMPLLCITPNHCDLARSCTHELRKPSDVFTSSRLRCLRSSIQRGPQTTLQVMPDDHSKLVPPLPIPNRTVKRLCADDSASTRVKVGHRQAKLFSRKQKGPSERGALLHCEPPFKNTGSKPFGIDFAQAQFCAVLILSNMTVPPN